MSTWLSHIYWFILICVYLHKLHESSFFLQRLSVVQHRNSNVHSRLRFQVSPLNVCHFSMLKQSWACNIAIYLSISCHHRTYVDDLVIRQLSVFYPFFLIWAFLVVCCPYVRSLIFYSGTPGPISSKFLFFFKHKNKNKEPNKQTS